MPRERFSLPREAEVAEDPRVRVVIAMISARLVVAFADRPGRTLNDQGVRSLCTSIHRGFGDPLLQI